MMTDRITRISGLTAVLLTSLLLGCGEDETCGPTSGERIVGRVVGPGGPAVDADITVEEVSRDEVDWMEIRSHTDEDGRFDIGVPPGQYLLQAYTGTWNGWVWYSARGPVSRRDSADVLHIVEGSGTYQADMILGGLDLVLNLPPEVQNRYLECDLYSRSGDSQASRHVEVIGESQTRFVFDFLPPGPFTAQVQVAWPGRLESSSVWLTSSMDPSEADSVEIYPGVTTTWETSIPSPGYLTGVVQFDWRRLALEPPTVAVYGQGYGMMARQRTDSGGEFSIPVFGTGGVRLRVHSSGPSLWVGGESYEDADEIVVGPGATVDVDPVVIGGLVCQLVGDPAWRPYSARITIYDESLSWGHGGPVRDDGMDIYLGEALGTHFFKVEPTKSGPWRPQWYDRSNTSEGATPVVVSNREELIEISFTLEVGGKIAGRVLDIDGGPAVSVDLHVSALNGHWRLEEITRTDWDGTFLVEGLPDDDIKIAAHNPGTYGPLQYTWYPGVRDSDSAQVITIEDAAEIEGIEWQLVP